MTNHPPIHWRESGYSRRESSMIAAGGLPDKLTHWPASPRYRVVFLERDGMSRDGAVAKARKEWRSADV